MHIQFGRILQQPVYKFVVEQLRISAKLRDVPRLCAVMRDFALRVAEQRMWSRSSLRLCQICVHQLSRLRETYTRIISRMKNNEGSHKSLHFATQEITSLIYG